MNTINPDVFINTLCIYIALISVLSVFLTVYYKKKAKKGEFRIPERSLLCIAALGGSLSMFITMLVIRHKTKHPLFMFGLPVMIIIQIFIYVFIIKKAIM